MLCRCTYIKQYHCCNKCSIEKKKKKILYKHTLDFAGPIKNSKTTSVENQSTPLHQIEEHQGILQNQRALYLVSVPEQGLFRKMSTFPMLSQNIELLVHA
jgi:hypothetical protein